MREAAVSFLWAFASDGKQRAKSGENDVEKLAKGFILRTLWPLKIGRLKYPLSVGRG